ncbi:VHS domain-containing protein [Immersiella caudata]|uniref:VHS domain-containing protein n=1 Tax=Immersiella caudata TaxID=314043 RepID=A0AA39WAC6_9PEZI|nr:VHS domain-containing protein [Immersiella caudata]
MEAASARYAARDRWGDTGMPAPSQLQRFIQAACSPDNYEPNLALNLEVADLINAKKGSTPREAAMAIVNLVNHRNPNISLLALNLLDICVKNCGYPFHLQISTKEFLNELVRRFPERPPIRPSRVQLKILEAIEEWRGTICETSRYREDLGFIRDMHRLLSFKGYTFPEVRREDAAVLNPSDNLKSAEEMEEEEREAQSAKLQELIRRGTPEDLREANQLMKVMAGFDTRSKVDYRAKAAEEVGKIQQKARLLEERLAQFKPGDKMTDGDVFSELAAALSSAQPKIQKMCEEESDDHEAVAKLLEINDSIHRTVERYKLLKKGDIEGANKIASGAPFQATPAHGPSKSSANELSLIDLDAEADTNGSSAAGPGASQTSGVENDLLGLSIGDSSYEQPGGIALGFGANTSTPLNLRATLDVTNTLADIPGGPLLSSITQNNTAKGPASAGTPTPPNNAFSQFSSFTSAPVSQSTTPQPPAASRSAFSPPPAKSPAQDPFAGLSSLGRKPNTPTPAAATTDDDEWSFSSALPPEAPPALPREQRAVVSNTGLKIDLLANRTVDTAPSINLLFSFTNNTAQPVSELHFQLAVTKGYELQLSPQSGRNLAPKQSAGITQSISVFRTNNKAEKVQSIKLRWRVSYKVGGEVRNEMGEIPEFSLA